MATKITLKQLGQDILDLLSKGGGSGDAYLTEKIVSNVACGAAPAGTLFEKDTEFTDFAKMLLLKDVTPSISFSASGSGLYKLGAEVNGSTLHLTINNLSTITVPVNSITFKLDNTILDTQSFVVGQNVYSFTYSGVINSNTTISAILTYSNNKTVSNKATFTFANPAYYGFVDDLTIDDSTVISLDETVKTSKAFTWNIVNMTNQRFCYAYPASQGALTSIKDANNFEYLDSYTRTTMAINNEDYYVYILTDPTTVNGFKQIYS